MTRKQKKTLLRILLAALLLVAAALLPAEGLWKALAFAVPWLVIGYDVLWDAVRGIAHGQVFDEKFLMAVATIGAFAVGEYPEAAAVMLFYQIGEWFQSIAVGRSRKSIAALMDIRPEFAVVLRDGQEEEVDPEEVSVGETILIRPGDRIPLDGTVLEGQSSLNTAALTGESLPVDVAPGDRVVSGSINMTGVLQVRAESAYEDSTVARILELVENSAEKKARVESFITRFARWYTPCVVIGALLLALVPPLFVGNWGEWIHRALIFLVVSCPCALVVSVPLSFFGGIGGASRAGILIKGANDLETLAKVDTVAFDKTGTLTRGVFQVDAVHPKELTADALLNAKRAAAAQKGVELRFRGAVPMAGIKDADLCVVLSNLVDNAVEAVERLAGLSRIGDGGETDPAGTQAPEKVPAEAEGHGLGVSVDAKQVENYLLLTVVNPLPPDADVRGTSKPDKKNHGLGLGNVRKTLGRIGGALSLERENGSFLAVARIPLEQ